MSELDAYKTAYSREKKARHLAEKLLEDKTRELYDNVLDLQGAVLELKTTQAQLIQSEKMACSVKSEKNDMPCHDLALLLRRVFHIS